MFLKSIFFKKKEKIIVADFLFAASIVATFLFTGCGGQPKKNHHEAKKEPVVAFLKDTLYNKVLALKDTSFSYALYFPDRKVPLPIIFFFDAHARGVLPVKKYRTLADKYGFILAGSNNSKNGMQPTQRNNIIYHFMEDVENRTPFDPNRIYLAGFSGGARIASGIGLNNQGIAAVVACAAGFPQTTKQPSPGFTFIGVVGNTDFNYLEMEALHRQLDALQLQNNLLIFDGKHDWPPLQTMDKVFQLLQLQAMQKGNLPKDTHLISYFVDSCQKEIGKALHSDQLIHADEYCKTALGFLKGLSPLDSFEKQQQTIEHNPDFNKQRYAAQQIHEKEQKYQQKLLRAMEVKESPWWKKELKGITSNATHANNRDEQMLNRRLLSYLSLISYLYADRALKENDMEAAAKFLQIYETSDPDNPEVYFMKAEYFASGGKPSKVLPTLKLAIEKGFNEPERIKNSKHFHPFYNKQAFQVLIKQAAEKAKENRD